LEKEIEDVEAEILNITIGLERRKFEGSHIKLMHDFPTVDRGTIYDSGAI